MRFSVTPKRSPQIGDKREFITFAWLPVVIGSTVVWLEKYRLTKVLEWVDYYPDMLSDVERRLTWVKYRSLIKEDKGDNRG